MIRNHLVHVRRSARGFTMIEMLVVISIIAVLASMLMPAIGVVKKSARATKCQGNLVQVFTGFMSYASDWHGQLPSMDTEYATYDGTGAPITGTRKTIYTAAGCNWGENVAFQMGLYSFPFNPSDPNAYIGRATMTASRLGFMNCPENTVQQTYCWDIRDSSNNTTEKGTSYQSTEWGHAWETWTFATAGPFIHGWTGKFIGAPIARLNNSDMIAIMEGTTPRCDTTTNTGAGTIPTISIGIGGVRYPHRGRCNLLYADGRVGSTPVVTVMSGSTATTRVTGSGPGQYSGNGPRFSDEYIGAKNFLINR